MNESKRVQATKNELRKALLSLMTATSFQKITVKAICSEAGVNRSTFYAYYTCPRDLLDDVENDIISHLPDFSATKEEQDAVEVFSDFLEYIRSNGDILVTMSKDSAETEFAQNLIEIVMTRYEQFEWLKAPDNTRMTYVYCIGGVISAIRDWIASGFAISADELSSILLGMCFRAAGLFAK